MVIGAAPQERAGAAAALNETGSQLGFALGIAVLGTLGNAVYQARIAVPPQVPASVASASRESYAGAVAAAHGLPYRIAAALLDQSRAAFTSGMHVTATTSAVLLVGVALSTVILLRHIGPGDEAVPVTVPDYAAEADAPPAVR
jgi:DHA2 family multidrug resistance protein-like MFS transporter